MTDDELIAVATYLCDHGDELPSPQSIVAPRLRRIVSETYATQARFIVPALLELIERRGLRSP